MTKPVQPHLPPGIQTPLFHMQALLF